MSATAGFGTGPGRASRTGKGRHLHLVVPGEAGTGIAGAGARPQVGTAPPGPVRLTLRGRRVLAAVMLLAVVAAGWDVLAPVAADALDARAGAYSGATSQVVVLPGDTLWSIARTTQPDTDPRDTVLRIQNLNGLPDSAVTAGQRLVVPVDG